MKNININKNLQGQKLKELLLFAGRRSNKMSLARYYDGNLTKEEFNQIQMEYKASIFEEDKKRRLRYKENTNGFRDCINEFYGTKMNEEKYFNDCLEQDLRSYSVLGSVDLQNRKHKSDYTKVLDCTYVKYTRRTPVTAGPIFEICYFQLGDTFKDLILKMDKLFEYHHYIEDTEFEDLTFYNKDRIILATCSHEGFAYMNLEDEEYEELLELSILDDMIDT